MRWNFLDGHNIPEHNAKIWALIDTIQGEPFTDVLITERGKLLRWKLAKFDPREQDEYLQQQYSVIAWKYYEDN